MITTLKLNSSGAVISDVVTDAKPQQDTTEAEFTLLSGEQLIQVIGQPRHRHDLEFVVYGDQRATIDGYAADKTVLKLERHGVDHIGIIRGNPDWNQLIGSTDPTKAVYSCRIVLITTGG